MNPESICQLVAATRADLPVIQTMATYYVYDMSEYVGDEEGWAFPETGLYECVPFAPYFDDPEAHPFLIRVAGELAGLAIVDKKASDPDIDFNMAQFWVHRKFKGHGVGFAAARQCFEGFPGAWEVNVIPANRGAFAFWSRIIPQCAQGIVEQSRRPAPHLRMAVKDFFRFRTDRA